jgi:hypothetical protein
LPDTIHIRLWVFIVSEMDGNPFKFQNIVHLTSGGCVCRETQQTPDEFIPFFRAKGYPSPF